MRRYLLFLSVLASATGCGPRDASRQSAEEVIPAPTREIRLVEDLRLGVEEPLFGNVSDIAVDADGFIYVAESDEPTNVFRFDSQGNHIGYLGAMGEGPGEFRRPSLLMLHADSIVILDGYYNRLLVLGR